MSMIKCCTSAWTLPPVVRQHMERERFPHNWGISLKGHTYPVSNEMMYWLKRRALGTVRGTGPEHRLLVAYCKMWSPWHKNKSILGWLGAGMNEPIMSTLCCSWSIHHTVQPSNLTRSPTVREKTFFTGNIVLHMYIINLAYKCPWTLKKATIFAWCCVAHAH